MKLGLIGGSGLYDMEGIGIRRLENVSTPFGPPSSEYRIGNFGEHEVVFLPRHGLPHSIPPHRVNYRANMFGFRDLGVEQVLSISATGGLVSGMGPGTLVLLDQVMDLTSGRESTFFEGPEVHHVDFTEPYCGEMRHILVSSSGEAEVALQPRGTYVCTNGPRLESRAEIGLYASWGGHVVGMTGMPEAVLARELELCYSAVAVVTNLGAGLSGERLTTTEVVRTMKDSHNRLAALLSRAIPYLCKRPRTCACNKALLDSSL